MATNNSINAPKAFQVPIGGTGFASTTAYAPICGGITTTSPLQAASTGQTNIGYVFTSNGSAALPSFQPASSFAGSANFKVTTNNNTPIPNLTGDGSNPIVTFPQVMWDTGGNYSGNAFTAPATGYYYFYSNILFQGIQAGQIVGGFVTYLLNGASGQANDNNDTSLPGASYAGGATPRYCGAYSSTVVPMNVGDVMQLRIQYGDGTQPQTIGIAASDLSASPQLVSSHWGGFRIA